MTADLVAFLNARYDEREQAAQDEVDLAEQFFSDDETTLTYLWARHTRHTSGGAGTSYMPGAPSPAEVLADIAAKRQLTARYERACHQADGERVADRWEEWRRVPSSATAAVREEWEVIASTLEGVLCQLASVYADHPDYRPEWKT